MNLHQRRYFKLLENVLKLPHELLLMMIPKIYLDLDLDLGHYSAHLGNFYNSPMITELELEIDVDRGLYDPEVYNIEVVYYWGARELMNHDEHNECYYLFSYSREGSIYHDRWLN